MSASNSMLVPRALSVALFVVVVGSIIASFWLVGSPSEARRRKSDSERSQDLSTIAQQVKTQVEQGHDPNSLTEIHVYQPSLLDDPETGKPYEYRRIDHLNFELCAVFETDTIAHPDESEPYLDYGDHKDIFGRHHAGRVCFKLNVKSFE